MPMKPEGKYEPIKYMTEAKIADVHNGAYEPKDKNDK